MEITLRATGQVDTIGGRIQARIWEGTTESGVPVRAWIAVIQPQTHDEAQLATFDAELKSVPYERRLASFDMRLVL